jgi:hypothetical protein
MPPNGLVSRWMWKQDERGSRLMHDGVFQNEKYCCTPYAQQLCKWGGTHVSETHHMGETYVSCVVHQSLLIPNIYFCFFKLYFDQKVFNYTPFLLY